MKKNKKKPEEVFLVQPNKKLNQEINDITNNLPKINKFSKIASNLTIYFLIKIAVIIETLMVITGISINLSSENYTTLSYLIIGIASVLALPNIIIIYQIKNSHKKWAKQISPKIKIINFESVYKEFLEDKNIFIKEISDQPSVNKLESNNSAMINKKYDIVFNGILQENQTRFSIGTYAIKKYDLDSYVKKNNFLNLQKNNTYRCLFLNFEHTSISELKDFWITKKPSLKKANLDNFYSIYRNEGFVISSETQTKILEIIKKTKFVPEILFKKNIMYLKLNWFEINGLFDNIDAFFNFQMAYNKSDLAKNIYNKIEEDCSNIALIAEIITIMKSEIQ